MKGLYISVESVTKKKIYLMDVIQMSFIPLSSNDTYFYKSPPSFLHRNRTQDSRSLTLTFLSTSLYRYTVSRSEVQDRGNVSPHKPVTLLTRITLGRNPLREYEKGKTVDLVIPRLLDLLSRCPRSSDLETSDLTYFVLRRRSHITQNFLQVY